VTPFRRVVVAASASQLGDWLYTVALVSFVYDATGSAAWLAALTLVRLGPYLVLEPLAGLLVDRVDPRTLLVASDVVRAGVMGLLAVLLWTGGSPLLALALTGVSTCASAAYPVALAVTVPRLVHEDRLVAANATLSTVETVAIVLGPSLGAGLLLVGSPALAVLLNAASFVVAAGAVAALPRTARSGSSSDPAAATTPNAAAAILAELHAGWAAVAGSSLAIVVIAFAVLDHVLYGVDTVLLLFVSTALGTGSGGVGYLFAAAGLGGVLAAVLGRRLVAAPRAGTILALVMIGYALPTAALLLGHAPAVAFALEVVHGAGFVLIELVAVTTLQRTLPAAVLGRVFGLYGSAVVGGILVGALVTPPLVHGPGLSATLVLVGAVPAAAALLALPALRPVDAAARAGLSRLAVRIQAIARLGLFAAASETAIERLAASAVPELIPGGTTVLRQGDPADDFFVVTRGELRVHLTGDGHTEPINRLFTGDYFGELGLLGAGVRTVTVVAQTDCAVLRIPGSAFADAMAAGGGASPSMRAIMTAHLARSRSGSTTSESTP
jgi:hypothetical protein